MEIISRAGWDARPPRNVRFTTATEIFLHHSVGGPNVPDRDNDGDMGDDYMRIMQNVHMDTNGWDDIAYNFAIDPIGLEIYEGRGWGVRPGAQKNYNTNTWAVVVMGDYRSRSVSPELLARIAELVRYGMELGHIPEGAILRGHKDAPNQSTSCPGTNLYNNLNVINELIKEDDMATAKEIVDELMARHIAIDLPAGESRSFETIIRSLRYDAQRAHSYSKSAIGRFAGVLDAIANIDVDLDAADISAIVNAIESAGIAQAVADEIDARARARLAE